MGRTRGINELKGIGRQGYAKKSLPPYASHARIDLTMAVSAGHLNRSTSKVGSVVSVIILFEYSSATARLDEIG